MKRRVRPVPAPLPPGSADGRSQAVIDLTSDPETSDSGRCVAVVSQVLPHSTSGPLDEGAGEGVYFPCSLCSELVLTSEAGTHELQHQLAFEREDAATEAGTTWVPSDSAPAAPKRRTGRCYRCGKPGHWAAQCPLAAPSAWDHGEGADEAVARTRLLDSSDVGVIKSVQRPCWVDPSLPSDGVVPALKQCLESQPGIWGRAYLCASAQHICSARTDMGWGCGWRNLQMTTWHLLRRGGEYRQALFAGLGAPPDVASLQLWLEWAWRQGYDLEGCRQLDGRVQAVATEAGHAGEVGKWIGSTDAATVLRAFGVRAHIIDFLGKKGDAGDSGGNSTGDEGDGAAKKRPREESLLRDKRRIERKEHRHQALIRWVWDYFAHGAPPDANAGQGAFGALSPSPVTVTSRPPLYFQHEGHSRTIVGIEKHIGTWGESYNLLLLDPVVPTRVMVEALQNRHGWKRLIKRPVYSLVKPLYQLMMVEDGLVQPADREQWKRMMATEVHR